MRNPGAASFARHWEALERSEERPRFCLDTSDQQTDLSGFFLLFVFFICVFFFLFFFGFLKFPLVLCYGYQKYCN